MLGKWEYTLNQKATAGGNNQMTLDSILADITKKEHTFNLKSDYKTIRYIDDDEYERDVYKYVQPQFLETSSKRISKPRFILFSAPGATGKTALTKANLNII